VFTTGSIKTVFMEHNYAGSFLEPSLSADPENDYWFVQGMAGVTTRMNIGGLDAIGDAIINQAELEVYGTYPPGDVHYLYPPIPFLITQEKTDSNFVNSNDVNVALARVNGNVQNEIYEILYGGVLEVITPGPEGIFKYKMKVTSQVKDIFQEKNENSMYLNPFEKANVPHRSVLFGPANTNYAPRLRIYYTAI
jgi:hypothetical protein